MNERDTGTNAIIMIFIILFMVSIVFVIVLLKENDVLGQKVESLTIKSDSYEKIIIRVIINHEDCAYIANITGGMATYWIYNSEGQMIGRVGYPYISLREVG